jgi:hypothetical protein
MIKYVFIETEDNQMHYTFYYCYSDREAIENAVKAYPNYITIGIISKDEYDSKSIDID